MAQNNDCIFFKDAFDYENRNTLRYIAKEYEVMRVKVKNKTFLACKKDILPIWKERIEKKLQKKTTCTYRPYKSLLIKIDKYINEIKSQTKG